VLSHLHQYVDCLALLEPLYNQLEPLDEGAAITICLLMVHMWLEARQPDKVSPTVLCKHMEKKTHLPSLRARERTGNERLWSKRFSSFPQPLLLTCAYPPTC
jgi:hypothetical protein